METDGGRERGGPGPPCDTLIMVGDMISVIDMPPPEESIWWRGKRGFEVGFFPCECVEVIGDKVPHGLNCLPGSGSATLPHLMRRSSTNSESPSEPTKPVLRKHGKLITFFRSFILSRPTRGKLKKRGILKERVFGCDLGEHLLNIGTEVPAVLSHCSRFIETKGIVDGIYRLSGISSNIQRLRVAFDENSLPDLFNDRLVLQDIHSVSSLLKMYFRELPNPVCTFHLYEKFVEAARSSDDIRLPKLRDVVSQLPPPNYRTLEYLTKHLHRVSLKHGDTGMTAKNVAIVWAPNLLRCKSLETGGVAALQGVGVQAVVTEYLIKYCELIFNDKLPSYSAMIQANHEVGSGTPRSLAKSRPKSLAISTPAKLLTLEEARNRALTACNNIENQKYIEVGGGPEKLPSKYHTVIDLPGGKKVGTGSFKQKKISTGSSGGAWKSIFSGGREKKKSGGGPSSENIDDQKNSTPSELHLLSMSQSAVHSGDYQAAPVKQTLRPVKSAESLIPKVTQTSPKQLAPTMENIVSPHTPSSGHSGEVDVLGPLETVTSAVSDLRKESPKCHSRSSSLDSYFERQNSLQFKVSLEEGDEGETSEKGTEMKHLDSSLDISEIQVNFDLEDNEMKIFSEDEAMMSTSLGSELSLPRSPLDCESVVPKASSPVLMLSGPPQIVRGSSNQSPSNLESPTKTRRMSFKEKLKKFTSPTMSRKQQQTSETPSDKPTNKMVDSGVGIDSDSCYSGSYEVSSSSPKALESLEDKNKKAGVGGGVKLKEQFVSALSPEIHRRSESSAVNSPKKKKSSCNEGDTISPNSSPQTASMVKRSKIETEGEESMTGLNLSPSIRFIDATSSYELGPLSDVTTTANGPDSDKLKDAMEIEETGYLSQVVEVQVHSDPLLNCDRDKDKGGNEQPISIIGGLCPTGNDHETTTYSSSSSSNELSNEGLNQFVNSSIEHEFDKPTLHIIEDDEILENTQYTMDTSSRESDMTSMDSLTSDDLPNKSSTLKEDSPTSQSDSISLSLAGATVSENESFVLDSTNDEEIIDVDGSVSELKDAEIGSNDTDEKCTQAKDSHERNYEVESMNLKQNHSELSITDNVGQSSVDKSEIINSLSLPNSTVLHFDTSSENTKEDPMETDLSIVSAELHFNNGIVSETIQYSSLEPYGKIDVSFDDYAESDSTESPGLESNTSDRSNSAESDSQHESFTSSPEEDIEPKQRNNSAQFFHMAEGSKSIISENTESSSGIESQPLSMITDSTMTPEPESMIPQESTDSMALKLLSPQMESVILRKSPSSPARNRSVRSDFMANLTMDSSLKTSTKIDETFHQPLKLEIPTPHGQDIGLPPLPKSSPPKPVTAIAKALSPQPYNKPPIKQMEENRSVLKHSPPRFMAKSPVERMCHVTNKTPITVNRDSSSPKLARVERAVSVEPTPRSIVYSPLPRAMSLEPNQQSTLCKTNKKSSLSKSSSVVPAALSRSLSMELPMSSSVFIQQQKFQFGNHEEVGSSSIKSVTQRLQNQSLSPVLQMEINLKTQLSSETSMELDDTMNKTVNDIDKENKAIITSRVPVEQGNKNIQEDCGNMDNQKIPDVTHGTPEAEKKIKFSNPDIHRHSTPLQKKDIVKTREGRSQSSTLSLHTLASSGAQEVEEEISSPPLQRRNSIHNVPFVDVNDPETRTRMERYKEERRSMLRAKYKAEDYLSNSYGRKKKVSTTSTSSSQGDPDSSTDVEGSAVKRCKSTSPPTSPEIMEDNESPLTMRKISETSLKTTGKERITEVNSHHQQKIFEGMDDSESPPLLRKSLESSTKSPLSETSNIMNPYKPVKKSELMSVSRKLVDLKQPEHTTFISRKSLPDNFDSKTPVTRTSDKESLQKKTSFAGREIFPISTRTRPSELNFSQTSPFQFRNVDETPEKFKSVFKANPLEVTTGNKVKSSAANDQIEDSVNVKERASIFGPRKISEVKVRTISAVPVQDNKDTRMRKISSGNNPTSPSKIKNMAAIFEQKH